MKFASSMNSQRGISEALRKHQEEGPAMFSASGQAQGPSSATSEPPADTQPSSGNAFLAQLHAERTARQAASGRGPAAGRQAPLSNAPHAASVPPQAPSAPLRESRQAPQGAPQGAEMSLLTWNVW